MLRSDAWDAGNHLTQFYEVIEDCEWCGGTGKVEYFGVEDKEYEECPECDGRGKVRRYI